MKKQIVLTLLAVWMAQGQPNRVEPGDPSFEVLHPRPNIYMLASSAGNVTVQVGNQIQTGTIAGNDGVLLVDSGPARPAQRLIKEIQNISNKPVHFIIETSADADHTGGVPFLTAPNAARPFFAPAQIGIFAQDNVLTRMTAAATLAPEGAWPTITFEKQKDFVFNGETVQIVAENSAHTDGDSIVHFRGSNVLSVGEIFRTTGFPVIDVKRGGSIDGELKALNHILEITVPDHMQEGGTMVIPGHGRLCDEADVADYRDMVTIVRDRVADAVKKGKPLADVKAAKLSRDYDGRYATQAWTGDMFIESIYQSLSGGRK